MLNFVFKVDDVLTDVTSVVFSDPDTAYGVRRSDTHEVVEASGTAWTHASTGTYQYQEDLIPGLVAGVEYEYWRAVTYLGETTRQQFTFRAAGVSPTERTLKFLAVADGVVLAADAAPKLQNPTGTYGVSNIQTGAVVVASATPMTVEGSGGYTYTFDADAEDSIYRYYVRAIVSGVTYYVPRTTAYVKSACLVFGRYTNSLEIEAEFGVDNTHKWLAIDDYDEAVDYALRYYSFIRSAESEVDDALRDGGSIVPFTDAIPDLVRRVAGLMAGVRAYESRGVNDVDPASGRPMHRLRFQSDWCKAQLTRIRGGCLRLETDDATRFPEVVRDHLGHHTHRDRTY